MKICKVNIKLCNISQRFNKGHVRRMNAPQRGKKAQGFPMFSKNKVLHINTSEEACITFLKCLISYVKDMLACNSIQVYRITHMKLQNIGGIIYIPTII